MATLVTQLPTNIKKVSKTTFKNTYKMKYRYALPQYNDEFYTVDVEFKLNERVNLKELFDIGVNKASKIVSILYRADKKGIYVDLYFMDLDI